jgi:hypothetical protein
MGTPKAPALLFLAPCWVAQSPARASGAAVLDDSPPGNCPLSLHLTFH